MATEQSWLLKTITGKQVYAEDGVKFTLSKYSNGFSNLPVRFRPSVASAKTFDQTKLKASKELKTDLHWVPGPMVDYINI
jgi:hypothetical protein